MHIPSVAPPGRAGTLPEDIDSLHVPAHGSESGLTEHNSVIAKREPNIDRLQEQVRLLLVRCIAPPLEKTSDERLGLFNETESTDDESERTPRTEVATRLRDAPTRTLLPIVLPRINIVLSNPYRYNLFLMRWIPPNTTARLRANRDRVRTRYRKAISQCSK